MIYKGMSYPAWTIPDSYWTHCDWIAEQAWLTGSRLTFCEGDIILRWPSGRNLYSEFVYRTGINLQRMPELDL